MYPELLLEKRTEIIEQFTKNNIISRGENFFAAPKKILKSTPKKPEDSAFEPLKVSKDKLDNIKLKTFRNKNLSTTIGKERYVLSDVNDLVNKTESKSISRDGAINSYDNIEEKGKKSKNYGEKEWTKMFRNYWFFLKKLFDQQPDSTDMPDLESEEHAKQNKKQKGDYQFL